MTSFKFPSLDGRGEGRVLIITSSSILPHPRYEGGGIFDRGRR
jgi:hypothetical protein